ncbi:putative Ser/Thr protein kinase [Thermocatellispora tengchongensis]|uniref:non-specific serine/threonine protein kinase n=1 Tax=Thermocatellispora tengchongensis TaxID=1073253 RepID=A0A840PG58_9ACTN|nr:serine/threonine-protein kinase [Thermocatellispora tengchongensis]MBB5138558.1 putative Ser/Thr protein kinase [Thermocatellispora tengchongensis]
MPDHRARVLAGRYELRAPLGQGGMGVVWRAWDGVLHQTVAVKEVLLVADPARREESLRRTMREARSAARLRGHPGIVTVYDVVEEDGVPWIVMELVEGRSLAEEIREAGPLPEDRVMEIGARVLAALAAAHEAGVVHRDVKPGNILISGDRVVLTDFGIAAGASRETSELTGGNLIGTPAYLAPELIEGHRAGPASDLWALGVTLYEAVEGRRPFERDTGMAVIAAILSRPPAPFQHAARLRPLIEGLLVKDPSRRLTAPQAIPLLVPGAQQTAPVPPRDEGSRRRTKVLSGIAVAASALAVAGIVLAARATGLTGETPPTTADQTTATRTAAADQTTATDQRTAATDPTASTAPAPSGTASLPSGFTLYRDERGFEVAVPDGWEKDDDGPSWSKPRSGLLDLQATVLGLNAAQTKKWTRSPEQLMRELTAGLQESLVAPGTYKEIALRQVTVGEHRGAELEFAFNFKELPSARLRMYARCLVRDSGGYAMVFFFAPEGDWAQFGPLIDTFKATFRLT